MIAIMAAVLLAKSRRDGFAKMYSVAACALTVLIVCIAMFSLNTPAVASGAWVVCTCYNMVVWAMLYYLVYQWRGGALRIVALGNAALSGGTLVASLLAMAYQASHISESAMKVIIALIGQRGRGGQRLGSRSGKAAGPMEACLRGGRARRGPVRP